MPIVPPGGPAGAADFRRTGTVRARRLHARRPWTRRSGDELHGNAGDWRVSTTPAMSGPCGTWTSATAMTSLGGDAWLRTGTYRAWRVSETWSCGRMEGQAIAQPGDWVVEGGGENAGRSPTSSSGALTPPRTGPRHPAHTRPRIPTAQAPRPQTPRPQTPRPQALLPRTPRPCRPCDAWPPRPGDDQKSLIRRRGRPTPPDRARECPSISPPAGAARLPVPFPPPSAGSYQ